MSSMASEGPNEPVLSSDTCRISPWSTYSSCFEGRVSREGNGEMDCCTTTVAGKAVY